MVMVVRLGSGVSLDSIRARGLRGQRLASVLMVCAALAVFASVLLMHSVPMTHPPGGHGASGVPIGAPSHLAPSSEHAGSGGSDVATTIPAVVAGSLHMAVENCTTDCSAHAGMAMCMAVITIAAALIVLRRLVRDRPGANAMHSLVPWIGRHASRAPPWAGPSLEKLSVLRI